jgi:adenosylcobalamin-dependent ribonucleoside-triphosphate reductase
MTDYTRPTYLSFGLSDDFIARYKDRPVPWGFTLPGGSSLGEITFITKYSRLKEDGTKERWYEACRRVIEGMYSLQKDYVKANRLPWNDRKAQASAQEAYDRLFHLKWTPPGRGMWIMGTPLVNQQKNSAPLQNCAFVSTDDMTVNDPSGPFTFLMEASMLGVGVGFDTRGAEKGFKIYQPKAKYAEAMVIPDTREGWVWSVELLLNAFLKPNGTEPVFDYSAIRKAGEPIKTFGGTAAGPGSLIELHETLRRLLGGRDGQPLTSTDIADIGNLIGKCVVAGNVRRSAEILLGDIKDEAFLDLKNWEVNPERMAYPDGWGQLSNNSVVVNVDTPLDAIVDRIAINGEPGVIWLDTARNFGRLKDGPDYKDYRVMGFNPCAEQPLESGEMCTLVETYLHNHESKEDFHRTLKFAYLYAKTVTLIPTHWPKTNAIMQRNRRIGTSASGLANFADDKGLNVLREWLDTGYGIVGQYDRIYSEWLCVRESIRTTTVKPSGTVSLMAGASPGVHWQPGGEYFDRAMRFGKDDPMVVLAGDAGYRVEQDQLNPDNVVVFFPVKSQAKRSEKQVSIYEKANLAVEAQRWWSDNAVSVTVSFHAEEEKDDVKRVLAMHAGNLKTISLLPMGNTVFPQMPYTEITEADYLAAEDHIFPIDFEPLYNGDMAAIDAIGEAFCSTDACEVKDLLKYAA